MTPRSPADVPRELDEQVHLAGAHLQEVSAAFAAETNGAVDEKIVDADSVRHAGEDLKRALTRAETTPVNGRVGSVEGYKDFWRQADDALASAEGGAAICRLTGQPRHALTDVGNARRFAEDHEGDLLSMPGGRKASWLDYDGKRYARDETGAAERRALATVDRLRQEAVELPKETADPVWKWWKQSQLRARVEAILRLGSVQEELVVEAGELDRDPFLLNLENGTLDLRTGELHDHSRADRVTKLAPVVFDAGASAPTWTACLEHALPDREVRRYLQKALGYSCTGDTREQCIFIPYGDGANAKSTILEAVRATLGDYAAQADASTFMTRRPRGVRSDVARLRGARFVPAVEVESDARFAEVLVKQMTGGDVMTASFLYENEFEFRPTFKVWLAANDLPAVRGTDHAIWRRMRVIPFPVKIERPDKTLPAKLREEVAGILNWLVEGCLAWQREGLDVPDGIREATHSYRSDEDTFAAFVLDRCALDPQATASPSGLYGAYELHCRRQGVEPLSGHRFAAVLRGRGFKQDRTKHGRFWIGIGVAE